MDTVQIIESVIMLIGFATLTKFWLDGRKLYKELTELIACVNDANKDGKVTQREFNTIMNHIMAVMKTGKAVVDDISNLKKEVEVLLKRKE